MNLIRIRDFLVHQKFRFDVGISFLTFINFSLLVITASDQIRRISFLRDVNVIWFLVTLVPLAFFGVWLFGYILDRFMKYYDQMRLITSKKDPYMVEMMDRLKNIEAKIDGKKDTDSDKPKQ